MSSRSPEREYLCRFGWRRRYRRSHLGLTINDLFVLHGGSIIERDDHHLRDARCMLESFIEARKGFIGLPEVLFNQPVPWLLEDLSPDEIGIISTLAHTDEGFRKRLRSYLGSFRSPPHTGSNTSSEVLLETHFNIDSTVTEARCSLQSQNWSFLNTISSWGTPSMLESFVKQGIDFDFKSLLRSAVYRGNHNVSQLLLDAGATIDSATWTVFIHDTLDDDEDFYRMVDLLLEYETSRTEKSDLSTTLLYALMSEQLRSVYPEALGVFLKRSSIDDRLLYGDHDMSMELSYMYWAILNDWPAALSFFLDRCVSPNCLIGAKFPERRRNLVEGPCPEDRGYSTWLTMAVELGIPACVDVLVKHGGDVLLADGCSRTPLGLSRMHADGSHPRERSESLHDFGTRPRHLRPAITVEQDAEILNILESAAAKLPLGDDAISNLSRDSMCTVLTEPSVHIVSGKEPSRVIRWLRKLPHFQGLEWYAKKLWYEVHRHSRLPFWEALLIRLGYVVSYLLLFLVEAVVLVPHLKALAQLPKSTLWAGFLLLVAVVLSLEAGSNGTK